jgi:hypothetical protein
MTSLNLTTCIPESHFLSVANSPTRSIAKNAKLKAEATDKKCDSGMHVVRLRDVIQKRNSLNEELHIKIRSSKTDQGSNSTTLVIYKQPHIAVCPVKEVN